MGREGKESLALNFLSSSKAYQGEFLILVQDLDVTTYGLVAVARLARTGLPLCSSWWPLNNAVGPYYVISRSEDEFVLGRKKPSPLLGFVDLNVGYQWPMLSFSSLLMSVFHSCSRLMRNMFSAHARYGKPGCR
nr:hypothetical protein [Tanacetum cinerariifolium]